LLKRDRGFYAEMAKSQWKRRRAAPPGGV